MKRNFQSNDKIYWSTKQDKNVWFEKSSGVCDSIWFPCAGQLITHFPKLAVRIFWLTVKISRMWNAFVTNYPNPYPDFFIKSLQAKTKPKMIMDFSPDEIVSTEIYHGKFLVFCKHSVWEIEESCYENYLQRKLIAYI